jgi:glutathione synthase/RimK-type ligase-like ATP-grasp enzyme
LNQSASGKRVLVTGGAIGDIPVILEAKSMGYEVFTSGNRENDPGHKFSDYYIKADYSNVFLLSEIMSTNSITYLIPSCHDIAYVTASKVAEKFKLIGFDDHELSERIHRKDELAIAIQEAGLRCIESELINDCDDALEIFQRFDQRVVVKPTDMTGGRGVSFVFDLNHLSNAIQNARNESIAKSVLIQKYISGTEHGFTAILKEKKVIFSLIDDEYRFLNRYRVAGTIFQEIF